MGIAPRKPKALSARALARSQAQRGHPVLPPAAWRKERLPKLLRAYGAHGYQFGRKHSRGHWGQQPALTFFTKRKHDPAKRGRVKPIPKWLEWKDGKHRHRLRTDVIELAEPLELQAVFGPGDGVAFGAQVASIGAAVNRPGDGSPLLTTAGHFLGDGSQGQTVTIASAGVTRRARLETSVARGSIDYALLRPLDAADCDNLFNDQIRIGPVFNATQMDVGTPVMILDRFGKAVRTRCRGVNARIDDGGVMYRGLITTDAVTESGQSGGALIDDANRLWGFLIGRIGDQMSIFVPAQTVLDHAGALLI